VTLFYNRNLVAYGDRSVSSSRSRGR